MTSTFLLISAFFVVGIGLGIYMLFPAIKGKIKSHGSMERMSLEAQETNPTPSPTKVLQEQIKKPKMHDAIIGVAKTQVSDYIYTIDDEVEEDEEGIDIQDFLTQEMLASMGVSADDLNEENDWWATQASNKDKDNLTSDEVNGLTEYMTLQELSPEQESIAKATLEKLSNTYLLEQMQSIIAEAEVVVNSKMEEFILSSKVKKASYKS